MNPTNNINDEIIREWGLSDKSPEEQASLVERIGRFLFQAILVRSLDILDDEEQDELDLILNAEDSNPADVLVYLNSKIPTLEEIRKEEIKKLKEDILV